MVRLVERRAGCGHPVLTPSDILPSNDKVFLKSAETGYHRAEPIKLGAHVELFHDNPRAVPYRIYGFRRSILWTRRGALNAQSQLPSGDLHSGIRL